EVIRHRGLDRSAGPRVNETMRLIDVEHPTVDRAVSTALPVRIGHRELCSNFGFEPARWHQPLRDRIISRQGRPHDVDGMRVLDLLDNGVARRFDHQGPPLWARVLLMTG